jgi:hypothetical protein
MWVAHDPSYFAHPCLRIFRNFLRCEVMNR